MKTQTKFRKVLSVLLSLAFILSMATLPVSVNAYDPITVTASTVDGAEGTDVVVSLSITANSGLATGTMLLKYDTTKLTYKSRTFGPASGSLNGFNANYANAGDIRTIYYAPVTEEGITDGGVMVNITFTCLAGWTGSALLELTASEMVDAVYSPLPFSTVNGSVNIPTPITPKTITFDTDGGTAVAPVTGMPGTAVTAPADPTKTGFTFAGWDPSLPTLMPDTDTTLVALWTPVGVTLTVTDGAGAVGDNVDIAVNISANSGLAAADLFLTFDNTKLTFVSAVAGTAAAGALSSITPQPPAGGLSTIRQGFALDDGLTAGGSMMIVTFTIKAGWEGTSTPLTLTVEDFFSDDYSPITPTIIDGEVACSAPQTYTITFNTNGGSAIAPVTGLPGTDVPDIADPVKAGFIFTGWDPAIPATFPSNDLTVDAQWVTDTAITLSAADVIGLPGSDVVVSISVTADSGLATGTILLKYDTTKLTYKSKTFGPAGGELNGFNQNYAVDGDFKTIYYSPVSTEGITAGGAMVNITFTVLAGWTGTSVLELTASEVVDKDYNNIAFVTEDGSVTVAAQSTITFDVDGGSAIAPVTGDVGDPVPPVENPTKDGYNFAGWSPSIPSAFQSGDLTVVAQWTPASYMVTFEASGGIGGTGPTLMVFGEPLLPPVVTREGYTFNRWSPTPPATVPFGGGMYYAMWDVNSYTITFDSDGGSAVDPITQQFGATVTAPADPTKAGFTFEGWSPAVPATMPAADTTCVALWEPLPQTTVTFDTAGGSTIDPMTGYIGDPLTAPADPTKAGFTFMGWNPALPATFPEGDMTVTALWEPIGPVTLIVTDASGATGENVVVYVNISADSGLAAADLFLAFDNTKLTLVSAVDGTAVAGGISSIAAQPPVGDSTTIKQGFAIDGGIIAGGSMMVITFTIKTGWTGTTPLTLTVGDFVDDSFNPLANAITNGTITCTTALTSTITFNGNGGAVSWVNITGDVGSAVPVIPDPTFPGYTFTGWSPALPATYPAEDITLTAQWDLNDYTITFDSAGGSAVAPITQEYTSAVTAPMDPTRNGYTFAGWEPSVPATMPAEDTTCVAQWDINTYTITFDSTGGTPVAPITQEFGTAVTAPADPTRTGYTFVGWDTEIPATMPSANLFIYAQWEVIVAPTSTITFNTDGGSTIDPITQDEGTSVTLPLNPTKTGYTFTGWVPSVPATMPTDDVTCVAQWTINSYPITFDASGGEGGWSMSMEFGAAITAPVVAREGYTFNRWEPTPPATVEGAATFYAMWDINSYTITFNSDGGTAVGPITQQFGTTVTAPADPTKAGFTFEGWSPAVPATMPAADTTCTAQWEAVVIPTSTITFDSAGGSTVDPITQDEGTAVTAPMDPTRNGYTFTGWEPSVPATMPYDDVTCVAQWSINSYTLTFNGNGGIPATVEITGVFGSAVTAPADPTREGYTFTGWDSTVPATMPSANMFIYAQWEINEYTITFDSAGGTPVAPITQDYNTTVTAPADPTRAGFTFAGWLPTVPGFMPAANTTCVAQWTAIPTSTITFDTDGGNAIDPITGEVGTDVPDVADPTKAGFTFLGWSPEIPATFPEQSLTVVAQWEEIVVLTSTITFDTAGGTAVASITLEEGTAVTAPADPTRTGYTFNGWLPVVPTTMPADDVTCVAQWTLNSYTITWDANGGTGGGTNSCNHGAMPTPIDAGTRTGYAFTGWSPTVVEATGPATYTAQWVAREYDAVFYVDGVLYATVPTGFGQIVNLPADPTKAGFTFVQWVERTQQETKAMKAAQTIIMDKEGLVLDAEFEPEPVMITITFNTDGGSAVAPITGEMGSPVTPPADPTKAGFTFMGWDPELPSVFPQADIEVTALWEAIPNPTSTITFDSAGGTAVAPITQDEGTAVTAPANPTKAGFTFMGWVPAVPTTMPVDDVTCVAQWQEILADTSTITFDTAGGSAIAPITGNVGAAVTAPASPTKEGYTFKGWVPTIPGTFPADDLTVVAQWEKNEVVPPTGDTLAGVAIFAAFSVAAAAAFVARKKKED